MLSFEKDSKATKETFNECLPEPQNCVEYRPVTTCNVMNFILILNWHLDMTFLNVINPCWSPKVPS